ncbi:hypothetical protein ACFPN0_00675 [Kitasatospora cinereorecta]
MTTMPSGRPLGIVVTGAEFLEGLAVVGEGFLRLSGLLLIWRSIAAWTLGFGWR